MAVPTDATRAAPADPAAPAPAPAPASPGTDHGDLACPLCDYSLRGLVEPRCPECGYAFDWDELTDPARRRHPYLFEHHPERNGRAFRRTLVGGLRPGRFWRDLHPTQPSRPRRLALYALLCAAVLALTVLAQYAITGYIVGVEYARDRQSLARAYPPGAAVRNPDGTVRFLTAAEAQALIDRVYPPAPSAEFLQRVHLDRDVAWARRSAVTLLAWPLVTFAALMIFRQSMARARVRTVHVARCVVYSADVIVWAALAMLALAAADAILDGNARSYNSAADQVGTLMWLATFLVAAWRLAVAYGLYLRMDRPRLTVAAAQAIVFLVLLLLWTEGDRLSRIGWWSRWLW